MTEKVVEAWGVFERGRLAMAGFEDGHDAIGYQILTDEFEKDVAERAGLTVRPVKIVYQQQENEE